MARKPHSNSSLTVIRPSILTLVLCLLFLPAAAAAAAPTVPYFLPAPASAGLGCAGCDLASVGGRSGASSSGRRAAERDRAVLEAAAAEREKSGAPEVAGVSCAG